MRVLLFEDDTDMLDVTAYALRKHGYDVTGVAADSSRRQFETDAGREMGLRVRRELLSGDRPTNLKPDPSDPNQVSSDPQNAGGASNAPDTPRSRQAADLQRR